MTPAELMHYLNSGYILVKIDRHEARKTQARTKWIIGDSQFKFVYSTYDTKKTHWYEYYLVRKNSILIRIRVSNRGNVEATQYNAEQLKVDDEELKSIINLLSDDLTPLI
jgi:hypothetical protein